MNALRSQLFLAACLLTFHANVACQPKVQKIKVNNCIISTVFQGQKYKGPLLEVTGSSITILSKGKPVSIPSNSIKEIKFKRTASAGRGAVVGGATGMFLGLFIGFASGDDHCHPGKFCIYQSTAEEKALAGGLVLGVAGSIVGGIIGAASYTQKIEINGDQKILLARQEDIRKYARPR